jgi:F0F1-type ATP synthase assembly protein I
MDNKERAYYLFALRIFGDFSLIIAAPVVVLVILGKYLDGRFHTSPWFTISAFVLSASFSGFTVYRKTKLYGKEYQKLSENK